MPRVLFALLLVLLGCSCSDGSADVVSTVPRLALPSPSAMLTQLPKRAKSTEDEVSQLGGEFEAALLNQHAVISGNGVVLSPQFNPPFAGAFSDLSCAIYRFNLASYDRDNSVQLRWGTPNAAAQTWIGLADMGGDRWEWQACPFDNSLEFADHTKYTAPGGDALVAIVMTGVGSFDLGEVRFGLPEDTTHELWFYLQTNLQVQQNVDDAIALVDRAADAGYTAVMLADSKLDRIDIVGSIYEPKLQQFDAACKTRGVKLVPALCSLGWAESILYHDPDLIEGQLFENVPFYVNGNSADSVTDAVLLNGGFESHTGDTFDDWNQV
nr:sugar phosphate isomerase/epimerase [bacterium]